MPQAQKNWVLILSPGVSTRGTTWDPTRGGLDLDQQRPGPADADAENPSSNTSP